jgi:large subunit ribosomal protein L40
LIRFFLHHPTTLTPRPLRFSRNRHLRHWTITRAWNLYRHNVKKAREMELERQYNAMRDANEELRLGAGDGGRLFRKAQMKTGVWGLTSGARKGGVPIEYARGLVEWVGSTGGLGVGTQSEAEGEGEGEGEGDAAGASAAAKQAKIWDHAWKRH